MRSLTVALCICLGAAGCSSTTTETVSRAPTLPQTLAPGSAVSGQIGVLLNEERRRRGLSPVSRNRTLDKVAYSHANEMARYGYFSHYSRNGATPHRRANRAGYGSCLTAENIARGQRSAPQVMDEWMASSGHRKNNLLPRVQEYGAAVAADGSWVLVLAKPGC